MRNTVEQENSGGSGDVGASNVQDFDELGMGKDKNGRTQCREEFRFPSWRCDPRNAQVNVSVVS